MWQLLILLVPVIYLLLILTCSKLLPYRKPFQVAGRSYDLSSAFANLSAAIVLHLIAAGVLVRFINLTVKEGRSWLLVSLVFYSLAQLGLLRATDQLLRSDSPVGDAGQMGCVCGLCGLLLLIPGGLGWLIWWWIGNFKMGGF